MGGGSNHPLSRARPEFKQKVFMAKAHSGCFEGILREFHGIFIGTRKRGHYERGFFTGGISRISRISKVSRISRNVRILLCIPQSRGSLESLESFGILQNLWKMDFSEKTPFPKGPFFRTRFQGVFKVFFPMPFPGVPFRPFQHRSAATSQKSLNSRRLWLFPGPLTFPGVPS